MKKFLKWVKRIVIVLIVIVIAVVVAFNVSSLPGALIIRKMFSGTVEIQDKPYFEKASNEVSTLKDITYTSDHKRNKLDIYYPKDTTEEKPIVFWIHGGGYVGGDKSSIDEFAHYLVYELDVAVVSINYELAPELHYPGQVQQADDAYMFLKDNNNEYPMLDFNQIIFGGDSAGAQIAAQYVTLQTNDVYASGMNLVQSVSKDSIKGYISFCGPLDLIQMRDVTSESRFMRFFMNTVGWSLTGSKNWRHLDMVEEISLVNNITEAFPASFITDGNTFSFPDQGKAFVSKLDQLGVDNTSLFFSDEESVVHEYQFNFEEVNAKTNLKMTLEFVSSQFK